MKSTVDRTTTNGTIKERPWLLDEVWYRITHLVYHMPKGRKKELPCRPSGRHPFFMAPLQRSADARFDPDHLAHNFISKSDWKFPVGAGLLEISGGPSHFPRAAPLDDIDRQADVFSMATRKPTRPAKATLSKGTVLAAKYRARTNKLTHAQRLAHRARAISII